MRSVVVTAMVAVVFAAPAGAETCREKFVRVFTNGNSGVATKSIVVQRVGKAKPSRNYHYHTGKGDWMTVMIEPDNGLASLVRDNVMYASTNKGKTWKKGRTMNSQKDRENAKKTQKEAASTVKNAVCGKEDLDGIAHNTVEADYEYRQYKSKYHLKYWVHPKTGWIAKTHMKSAGFSAIQTMEPAPDLKLPQPK